MSRTLQPKLTLVVDPGVVRRAKSYAATHRTSVSSLVESYLRNLTAEGGLGIETDPDTWPPITRSLYGALADVGDADTEDLRFRYLREKYLRD
jgi:hypothetical protein